MQKVQWNKLDHDFQEIYRNYLAYIEAPEDSKPNLHPAIAGAPELRILLMYLGDLDPIEELGFKLQRKSGTNLAEGIVQLADVPALTSHEGVVNLDYGAEEEPFLEDSVPEILARGAAQIWDVNQTTGVFSGSTGEDVIIGIIDSGIDWKHPDFLKQETPTKESRILAIWDPGLSPTGTESSPNQAWLNNGSYTYGVEYINYTSGSKKIDDELQTPADPPTIRHRDCNSHGTHVASICAGDGRSKGFMEGDQAYTNIGVAPKAWIVAVKVFSLQNEPQDSGGSDVGFSQRFKDAVYYIRNVAANFGGGKPYVINYSGGSSTGAHDGLSATDQWISNEFASVTGGAFVVSAGNSGNSSRRAHAVVTVPSGGMELEIELTENRTITTDKTKCTPVSNTRTLFLDCWYDEMASGQSISAALKVEGGAAFSPAKAIGGGADTGTFDTDKTWKLYHESVAVVKPPSTSVTRNRILVTVSPKKDADNVPQGLHLKGTYTLKITGDPVVLLVYLYQARGHSFKFPEPTQTNVTVNNANTIGSPGSAANLITVAAHDDDTGDIANFSSRGPLLDFSGTGPVAAKPDISAPGVQIKAAKSGYLNTADDWLRDIGGSLYVPKSGTSMSAPHVAGLVALLLEKDPTLTHAQIKALLMNHTRTATPPNDFGDGKVDAKESWDNA